MNTAALQQLAGKIAHYPAREDQYETDAIRQFALDNSYQYKLSDKELVRYKRRDYRVLPAWLGMTGFAAGKDAYHIVSGSIMDYTFEMFLMYDKLADGAIYDSPTEEQKLNYTRQQTTGIIRVYLPKVFPQVVLDSMKNDGIRSSVGAIYEHSQRLNLEGDFNDHFDLYAPVGLQINVLTLLAPNMMQILQRHSGLFDVEFYGNEMILFTKSQLYDPAVMTALHAALTEQLAYLTRMLFSRNYQPTNQPFDLLKKPMMSGRMMRIGKFRLSPKAQIAGILLGFVVFGFAMALLNKAFPDS